MWDERGLHRGVGVKETAGLKDSLIDTLEAKSTVLIGSIH